MQSIHKAVTTGAVLSALLLCGCYFSDSEAGERSRAPLGASRGEHDRDGDEHGEGGEHGHGGTREHGEESGAELALDEIYDRVRNGVRLTLAYHPASNTFEGELSNTTDKTLRRARVEVHLSNGTELGPTTPVDLAPGMQRAVTLTATNDPFDRWTAHAEVGSGEHH